MELDSQQQLWNFRNGNGALKVLESAIVNIYGISEPISADVDFITKMTEDLKWFQFKKIFCWISLLLSMWFLIRQVD